MTVHSFEDGFHAGRIQEKVSEHDRRLDAINGSIDRNESATTTLTKTVNDLGTEMRAALAQVDKKVDAVGVKVGVYVAVGVGIATIVGSTLSALAVYYVTH